MSKIVSWVNQTGFSAPTISQIRQMSGISATQLAMALGFSRRIVLRWEQHDDLQGSTRRKLVWLLYLTYLQRPGGWARAALGLPPDGPLPKRFKPKRRAKVKAKSAKLTQVVDST